VKLYGCTQEKQHFICVTLNLKNYATCIIFRVYQRKVMQHAKLLYPVKPNSFTEEKHHFICETLNLKTFATCLTFRVQKKYVLQHS
jgi:hypothetical protein